MPLQNQLAILMSPLQSRMKNFACRLRYLAALDGIRALAVRIILFGWCDFLADYFFEFPDSLRAAFLVVASIWCAVFAWRRIISCLLFSLRDEEIAAAMEYRCPELNGSLLTAIELRDKTSENILPSFHASLLARAEKTLPPDLPLVLRASYRRFFVAVTIFLLTVFCIARTTSAFSAFEIWCARNLFLQNREWEYRTSLFIDGFDDEKRCVIPRGSDLQLIIRACADSPRVPDYLRFQIGNENRILDQFENEQFKTEKIYRVFTETIPDCASSFSFTLSGAGVKRETFNVEVVTRPTCAGFALTLKFPDYLRRENMRVTEFSGRLPIPDGTTISLEFFATRALRSITQTIHAQSIHCGAQAETKTFSPAQNDFQNNFEVALENLCEETSLEFVLCDELGITSDIIPFRFSIIPDAPPTIQISPVGIGAAITPNAIIPLVGKVSDDYALTEISLAPRITRASSAAENPQENFSASQILLRNENLREYRVETVYETTSLALQIGDSLQLSIAANDSRGAQRTEIVGNFSVVAPEQLQATLETQEIMLRQRLERLIEETKQTQTALATNIATETQLAQQRLARFLQKQLYELQTITSSLKSVQRERQNNHLEEPAQRERFAQIFPRLERLTQTELPQMQKLAENFAVAENGNDETRNTFPARLENYAAQLTHIRDLMLAMESYHELIERLRQIIQLQKELRDDTSQERRDSLRRLAE